MSSILAVSPAAMAEVLQIRSAEWAPERLALRIDVTVRQWAEFTFRFVPLEQLKRDDIIERHGELPIAISPAVARVLPGAQLMLKNDLVLEYNVAGGGVPQRQRTLVLIELSPGPTELFQPTGLVVDVDGALYVADRSHRVRKRSPDGRIVAVAGTGAAGFAGDGGAAASAALDFPTGLALGTDGSLYIADTNNHRIRKIAPDGQIKTVAGVGVAGFNGDHRPATEANFDSPWGLACDRSDNLFIADFGNRRIRKLEPSGIVVTVAGNGGTGVTGDGGPAKRAEIGDVQIVAVDADGRLYISDGKRIRKVTRNGTIRSVSLGTEDREQRNLNTVRGLCVDPSATMWLTDYQRLCAIDRGGLRMVAEALGMTGPVCSGGATIYVASNNRLIAFDTSQSPPSQQVLIDGQHRRLLHQPAYRQPATPQDRPQTRASGVTIDAAGELYVSERVNHRVRKISANGYSTIVADALQLPGVLAIDPNGTLYIADDFSRGIFRVREGRLTRAVSGGTGLTNWNRAWDADAPPYAALAADAKGQVYVADTEHNCVLVLRTDGSVERFAGTGSDGFSGDGGPATEAEVAGPDALTVDPFGNTYIGARRRIRVVTTDGRIHTIAGTGESGFTGDGGPATEASLTHPRALAVDPQGDLYVVDHNRIRRVDRSGCISSLQTPPLHPDHRRHALAISSRGELLIGDGITQQVLRVPLYSSSGQSPSTPSTLALPASLEAAATLVGVERVYAQAGQHGSCTSYASPLPVREAAQQIEAEHGRPSSSTPAVYAEWRATRRGDGSQWIRVIELYDGQTAVAPRFDPDSVPDWTQCMVVVTDMYEPVASTHALRRLWRWLETRAGR